MPVLSQTTTNNTGTVCTNQVIAGKSVVRCVRGNPSYTRQTPPANVPAFNGSVPNTPPPTASGSNLPTPIVSPPSVTPSPVVTPVQQQEYINNFLTEARKTLHPQAGMSASIRFDTTTKLRGMFATVHSTSYRFPDYTLVSISTVPGDFTGSIPNCYQETMTDTVSISYITNKNQLSAYEQRWADSLCLLEPGKTYYFNLKFTYPDGRNSCPTDNCGLMVDVM